MREIKFRGRNYDGIWMYGYLMPAPKPEIHPNCKHIISAIPHTIKSVDRGLYEVDENTVGQYTGLKDSNGNEIYEGDIIMSEGHSVHYVMYLEDEATFIAMIVGSPLQEWCGIRQSWIDKFKKKIIGNIHDNSELLKQYLE